MIDRTSPGTVPGERLDRDVGDPEEDARGGARACTPRRCRRPLDAVREQQQRAEEDHRALEGDHPGDRSSSSASRPSPLCTVRPRKARPTAVSADAHPLAPAELEAEPAVGEHGEEHEAAGDDRLHQRDRGQRERRDVEDPGDERDRRSRSSTTSRRTGRVALRSGWRMSTSGASTAPRASTGRRGWWRRRSRAQAAVRFERSSRREGGIGGRHRAWVRLARCSRFRPRTLRA